jgi:SulP family sulfate permease
MAVSPSLKTPLTGSGLRRYLPFLNWLVHYRRADLPGDLVAGLVTAIMLP